MLVFDKRTYLLEFQTEVVALKKRNTQVPQALNIE